MRSMTVLAALFLAVPVFAADPTLDPVDARVLAEFKTFAEQEADRGKAAFRRYVDSYIVEPRGLQWIGKKHIFKGYKLEAVPNVWTFDVRKTDSIVSPYQGVIEFPVIFIRTITWAKGFKEDCSGQPLQYCLDHDGELWEPSKRWGWEQPARIPQRIKRDYVYQENTWVPKVEFKALMDALVALLDSKQPLPVIQPPSLFGVPRPMPAPAPAPTPEETTTS